jgi:hypothetical protein
MSTALYQVLSRHEASAHIARHILRFNILLPFSLSHQPHAQNYARGLFSSIQSMAAPILTGLALKCGHNPRSKTTETTIKKTLSTRVYCILV